MTTWNDYYSLFAVTDILRGNNPATRVCQGNYRFEVQEDGRGRHVLTKGPQHECIDEWAPHDDWDTQVLLWELSTN